MYISTCVGITNIPEPRRNRCVLVFATGGSNPTSTKFAWIICTIPYTTSSRCAVTTNHTIISSIITLRFIKDDRFEKAQQFWSNMHSETISRNYIVLKHIHFLNWVSDPVRPSPCRIQLISWLIIKFVLRKWLQGFHGRKFWRLSRLVRFIAQKYPNHDWGLFEGLNGALNVGISQKKKKKNQFQTARSGFKRRNIINEQNFDALQGRTT